MNSLMDVIQFLFAQYKENYKLYENGYTSEETLKAKFVEECKKYPEQHIKEVNELLNKYKITYIQRVKVTDFSNSRVLLDLTAVDTAITVENTNKIKDTWCITEEHAYGRKTTYYFPALCIIEVSRKKYDYTRIADVELSFLL